MKSRTAAFAEVGRWALLLGVAQLAGCSRRAVTQDECERLLTRYTEMLTASERTDLSGIERGRLVADVRTSASSYAPFQRCTAEVGREQMDCALAAYNLDEIERCLIPIP